MKFVKQTKEKKEPVLRIRLNAGFFSQKHPTGNWRNEAKFKK
jgi:hypothetical protein